MPPKATWTYTAQIGMIIWTQPALQQTAPVKPKFMILHENPNYFPLLASHIKIHQISDGTAIKLNRLYC